MAFRVGQKVVCIKANFYNPQYKLPHNLPKVGDIYTIRNMDIGTCGDDGVPQVALMFHELVYPVLKCGFEFSFSASSFRPLVDRKTDISIFTRMLKRGKADA